MKTPSILLALALATAFGARAQDPAVDHSAHHAPVQSDGDFR